MLRCRRPPICVELGATCKDDHQNEGYGPQEDNCDGYLSRDVERSPLAGDKDPAVEEDDACLDKTVA